MQSVFLYRNPVLSGCWLQVVTSPIPKDFYDKFDEDLPDNCCVPNNLPTTAFYGSEELLDYTDISSIGNSMGQNDPCLSNDVTKSLRLAFDHSYFTIRVAKHRFFQFYKDYQNKTQIHRTQPCI